MKILLSNIFYLPKMGGVERYIENIAKQLIKLGHEVFVVCYHHDSNLKQEEIIDKVKVIRILKDKPFPETYKKEQEIIIPEIKKIIEKNNIDLYIAGRITFVGDFEIKTICIPPTILRIFEQQRSERNPNWVWFNDPKDIESIEKSSLEKSDLVITLSEFVRTNLINLYKIPEDKIKVISPGVEKRTHSKEELQKIKDKFNLNNKKIILMVGRLSEEKNPKALIEAFSHVKSKATLLIVGGEKPKIKELKELGKDIENEIIFTGWQDPFPFYDIADIYVLPSFSESFGLVLLEAMIAGLPCIAFKPDGKKIITASEELITDNKNGFLVKDRKEMAEKIDLLLSDNNLKEKMKQEAITKAKGYDWNKSARLIVEELKSKSLI